MGCGSNRFDSEMSGDKFADPFKSQSWTALKWCNCCFERRNSPQIAEIGMKRFNSRPTEWQAFIDGFDSAVHSNPKLSNIDKMNYLKSLVEGPAAAAIKGLPLTSENYN